MFQFRRFPTYTYLIQCTLHRYCLCGLPHSEIPGSMDICSSPRLIAACHVLRRLLMPRHSPCALSSLTNRKLTISRSFSFVNYAGNLRFIEIVIVTHHLFRCCSTIKITSFCVFSDTDLSVALLITFQSHCSVFKVHSLPTALAVRFEDPNFRLGLQIQQQSAWWARVGSNHRPYDYQSYALAS